MGCAMENPSEEEESETSDPDPTSGARAFLADRQRALAAIERATADARETAEKIAGASSVIRDIQRQTDWLRKAGVFSNIESVMKTAGVLARNAQGVVPSSVAKMLATGMSDFDQITPSAFKGIELGITANAAKFALGSSGLSTLRASLLAAERVTEISKAFAPIGNVKQIADLIQSSGFASDLARKISDFDPTQKIVGPISSPPTRAWGQVLQQRPTERSLIGATFGGHHVASLIGGEALLDASELVTKEFVAEIEEFAIEPWRSSPFEYRTRMLDHLAVIAPDVPELLDGAWDDIRRNGPAAVTKIADCGVEAIDRTLRALAKEEDVLAWHAEGRRPAKELNDGKVTRTLRVRYILREQARSEVKLTERAVEAVVEFAAALSGPLQDAKHTLDASIARVRSLFAAAEAALGLLVTYSGHDSKLL